MIKINKGYAIEDIFLYKGYWCAITCSQIGHRCGYVKIDNPKGDAHMLDYIDYEVHGGITYSMNRENYPIPTGNGFWIGFDCAHASDAKDKDILDFFDNTSHYYDKGYGEVRDNKFVKKELKNLVEQLIVEDVSE